MDCRVTVLVAAPPGETWRRWTDFAGWGRWNPSCVEASAEEPLREGSQLDLRLVHPRGRDFYTRPRITAVEEPRRIAWRARGPGLRADTDVVLVPEGEGTRVTLTATSSGPMAFAFRMTMRPKTQARMYMSMLNGLAADMGPR